MADERASGSDTPVGMTTNPWRRLARRLVYENPWVQVNHDDVIRPDGQPGIYGVVHFRNRAVGVVALDEAGRVLLVGQYRYALDRYSWELPEGGVPEGEDTLAGAQRELLEETGCTATTWQEIATFELSNSVTDEAGVLYLATGLTDGAPSPDGTEEIAVRWVSFEEALALIDRGEIRDVMTQLGLERVARRRHG